MILVVLILAAAGCGIAGVLSGNMLLGYIALGLSALAALIFAVVLWSERRPAPEVAEDAAEGAEPDEAAEGGAPVERVSSRPKSDAVATAEVASVNGTVPASGASSVDRGVAAAGAEGAGVVTVERPVSAELSAEAESHSVHVIPGRKRFHRAGCRILEGHATEELALADASDEGFTPCSSCH